MAIIPTIRCSSIEASLRFYTEILGFEVLYRDEPLADPGFAHLSREGERIMLSSHRGDGVFGQAVVIETSDVDAVFRTLRDRGLELPTDGHSPVHEAPLDQTWGSRELYVNDPDGNTLRFVQWRDVNAPRRSLGLVSLVVRDYDEAIRFFTGKLGFRLVEDETRPAENKRWVVVAPGGCGTGVLLARAKNQVVEAHVGNQTGGRVAFFIYTDDFRRDYERFIANGVRFVRPPSEEAYGTVAVFEDLYGNLWDLLQPRR